MNRASLDSERLPHSTPPSSHRSPQAEQSTWWGEFFSTEDASNGVVDRTGDGPSTFELPDYEVLGLLGRGGMGEVYLAKQISLDRQCALKVLGDRLSSESAKSRFANEARLASSLEHPGIVQVYDYGCGENFSFYSMARIEGASLEQVLTRTRPDLNESVEIIESVAGAVAYAHNAEIVHRDLKPGNILVRTDGRIFVADFGLARGLQDDRLTATQQVLGTPRYMSPEQARGEMGLVDKRSDVHAIGIMLYELLTGKSLFAGEDVDQTLHNVKHARPQAPHDRDRSIPIDLSRVCMKCLEKDPRDRYSDAQELALDLARYRSGKPTVARPIGWGRRAARLLLRNRLYGAVVVAGLLLVGLGLWFSVSEMARRDRQLASERQQLAGVTNQLGQVQNDALRRRIELLLRRADWGAVLSEVDTTLSTANADVSASTIAWLRLQRLRALAALMRLDEAREEAERLLAGELPAELRGAVLLWGGDLNSVGSRAESLRGVKYLEDAIAEGLEEADLLYAEALLADSAIELVEKLEAARRLNPFDQRILSTLAGNLIWLGCGEQASEVIAVGTGAFPDDPVFPYLNALATGLAGDYVTAESELSQLAGHYEMNTAEALEMLKLQDKWLTKFFELYAAQPPSLADYWAFRKVPSALVRLAEFRGQSDRAALRLPALSELSEALADVALAITSPLATGQSRIEAARRLAEFSERHPEATITFLAGALLCTYNDFSYAADVLDKAAKRPSIHRDTTYFANFWGVVASYGAYISHRNAGENDLAEAQRQKCGEFSRAAMEGEPSDPYRVWYVVRGLVQSDQKMLGWQLAEAALAKFPESESIGALAVQTAFENEMHERAIAIAEQLEEAGTLSAAAEKYRNLAMEAKL